jgi:lactoylglutathione lyase
VKEVGPAVGYYTQCLGFTLVSRDRTTAVLRRDDVQIGLAVNDQDPEQASCWFSVGDVDALWREYEAKGIGPGMVDEQQYDGKPYRVFFAKEPYGVCFGMVQKGPFQGNTRNIRVYLDRTRVGAGFCEHLVAVPGLQLRANRVYPRSSNQWACA